MSEDYRFRLAPHEADPCATTTTEARATVPDLHLWRYEPPADECEHGATVTDRLRIQWANGTTYETTEPVTYCYICHQLAPDPTTPSPTPDEFTFTIEPLEDQS